MPEPIEIANRYFQEGNYLQAITILTDLLIANPEDRDIHYNRALCFYFLKNYKRATEDLNFLNKEEERYILLENKIDSELKKEYKKMRSIREKSEKDQTKTKSKFFKTNTTFADVVGMEKEKQYLKNHILLPLEKPDLFLEYGKRIGSALILYGAPGTGKTYISKALAGEGKANMIIVNQREVLNMYYGESEKAMHNLFELARKNTPAIMLFDEFEGLTSKRGKNKFDNSDSQTQINLINTLLQELQGLEDNPQKLFFIGLTNRPWEIDPAFKRSGRFSDSLYVPPPTSKERKALFEYYLKNKPTELINYTKLVMATESYTSADIAHIVEESLYHPLLEKENSNISRKLTTKDIIKTINKSKPTSSLDEWYAQTKKELLGGINTTLVNGKLTENFETGNLQNEERSQYKDLIKDIERHLHPNNIRMIKIKRWLGRTL